MLRHAIPLLLLAAPAQAHPGHVADLAGHDHWVLGAGLGAIALAGLLGWLKGGEEAEEPADEDAAAPEEASA